MSFRRRIQLSLADDVSPWKQVSRIAAVSTIGVIIVAVTVVGLIRHSRSEQKPASPEGGRSADATTIDNSSVETGDIVSTYTPPIVRDPSLAVFVNRQAPLGDRLPQDITSRLPLINEADVRAVETVMMDWKDDAVVRNEAVNLLRRSGYEQLTSDLIQVMKVPEEGPRFRAFCMQHLWQQLGKAGHEEREKIASVLHQSLADRHVEVRREALLALVRMRAPQGQDTAVAWLSSSGPDADAVRDLAIRCVQELGLRTQIPNVRKHVRSSNEVVRIAAIVALSQWGDEESRPAFEEAAKSSSVRLQRAGKAALERLDKAKNQKAQTSTAP